MVVVTAADGRYALPLAVMGRSLIDNLSPRRKLALYVLDGGIPVRERQKVMASWDLSRADVRWIEPPRSALRGIPILKWYGPTIYFRLLAPRLLPPRIRKAIYLDADVLVLDDVSRLWKTGLGGTALGAVQDTGFLHIRHASFPWAKLGLPPTEKYLNSGVLLMDLARWRRERLADKVLAYLRALGHKTRFPDQDALNIVFLKKWRQLHPRWNVAMDSARNCLRELPREERSLLAQAIARPSLLHFVERPKPWKKGCLHRRLFLYYIYLDRTWWRGWRPGPMGPPRPRVSSK